MAKRKKKTKRATAAGAPAAAGQPPAARPAGEAGSRLGWRGWAWRLGLAALSGCGVFLAFPTWDLFFLAWFCLVPLLLAVEGTSPRQHLLLGLWAGAITNLGGFWWIGGMLMDFGHMGWWPAAGLTLLMAVYQGLVFALWLWLLARLRDSGPRRWLLAPLTYVAAEFAVWYIFPWYYANSQYNCAPLIQICELGGVGLLSFGLVMANAALADAWGAWRAGRRRPAVAMLGLALGLPAVVAGYGLVRIQQVDAAAAAAPELRIGLVEADVGIWEKEERSKLVDNLVRHQRMSMELERRGAELIIWPETAYRAPFTYVRRPGAERARRYRPIPRDAVAIPPAQSRPPAHAVEDRRRGTSARERTAPQRGFSTPLLFGALTQRENPDSPSQRHPGTDLLNTAILLDAEGRVLGMYDKVYLLVFGEYIPFGDWFPVFYRWLPEAGDLTPGEGVEVLRLGDHRLGVMICYEDILPAFIRRVAEHDPHVLINITNDAWFGETSEPYLHLALAVFRTVEARVPLVRSTNTGVSAFVDPVGRITAQTSLQEAEILIQDVPMMDGGTPYQLLGDWPAYLCFAALVLLWWRSRRRRNRASGSQR
jgi:apolipoprotein N-acyltransferase